MRSRLLAAICLSISFPLSAADVTVLSGGAVKSGLSEAAIAWEKKTGNRVNATYAPAGEMMKRLKAGERFDLVIIPAEALPELANAGVIADAISKDIAAVAIGVAVRKGAPVPDISTPEAVKKMLVGAKSLTYMDPSRGTSGKFFDEVVLPKLGVRDEVRAKTMFGEGGMIAEKVARGEVELAVHQVSEILPVAGITLVGPLPPALQKVTIYTGAPTRTATTPAEAAALLAFLVSPEARSIFLARGFSAP